MFGKGGIVDNPYSRWNIKGLSAGRSGVIRTLDPHVPNVVRYQTALHSVTSGASIEQAFRFDKRKWPKKCMALRKR